jgi:integrase
MSKTVKDYLKEYETYLLNGSYSQTSIHSYLTAVKELIGIRKENKHTKDGRCKFYYELKKKPTNLTLNDIIEHTRYIKENRKYWCKRSRLTGTKNYIIYLKVEHNSKVYDEYLKRYSVTNNDIFKVRSDAKPKKEYDILEPEEIDRLLKASYKMPRDFAILTLFKHTGHRGGTIQNLNISGLDLEGYVDEETGIKYHRIKFESGKFNQTYDIEIEEECMSAIKRYLKFREKPKEGYILNNYRQKLYHKDAVFLNGFGKRYQEESMRKMFQKYASMCGLKKHVYNHLWRATFVTLADGNGVSIGQIMKRTGHTRPESLQPYLNTKIKDSNRALISIFNKDNDITKPKPKPIKPKPKPELKPEPKPIKEDKTERYIAMLRDKLINEEEFLKLIGKEKDYSQSLYG